MKKRREKTVLGAVFKTLIFFVFLGGLFLTLIYFGFITVRTITMGDLLVTLQTSKESVSLDTGGSENITFFIRAFSMTNCTTECEISFVDDSSSLSIDRETVLIDSSFQQLSRTYRLNAPEFGEGQRLYNFKIHCQNVYTEFCKHNETIVNKNSLITLNYHLPENIQTLKPDLKQRLEGLLNGYSAEEVRYKSLKAGLSLLGIENSSADTEFNDYTSKISSLAGLWNKQDYSSLNANIGGANISALLDFIDLAFTPIREFNSIALFANQSREGIRFLLSISGILDIQNDLSEKFSNLTESIISKQLEAAMNNLSSFNSSYSAIYNNASSTLDSMIIGANLSIIENATLFDKFREMRNYCNAMALNNSVSPDCSKILNFSLASLPDLNFSLIPEEFNFTSTQFNLSENLPICCIFGKCSACCTNESCSFTPVILLHGHLFNVQNSPDYSVTEFKMLQNELEKNGYINAGTITPDSSYFDVSEGEWGLTGNSLSVSATYYSENEKNLSIAKYSAVLNDEINLVKFRSGQKKVDIIAHSMGGLVAREYINMYGEDSVNKLILIAAPNNGTTRAISSLCPLFGSQPECQDMQEGSPFLTALNSYNPTEVRLYNILGSGCDMYAEDGDGIITLKNAVLLDPLNPVMTYKITGTCPSVTDLLHTSILNVQRHPETFKRILDILKS